MKLLKQAGWRDSCKRQCSLLANLQPVVPSHQLWGFTCDLFACDLKHEAVPVELSAASVDNSACELPVPSDAAPAAAKGNAKVNGKRKGKGMTAAKPEPKAKSKAKAKAAPQAVAKAETKAAAKATAAPTISGSVADEVVDTVLPGEASPVNDCRVEIATVRDENDMRL